MQSAPPDKASICYLFDFYLVFVLGKLDNHFPSEMRLHIGGSSGLFLLLPKVQLLYINVCVCCALCCITSSRHPLGLENVFLLVSY